MRCRCCFRAEDGIRGRNVTGVQTCALPLLCRAYGVDHAWELLTGDLLDPRPERLRYTVRALFLVWVYAWGIASDVVAKGGARSEERRVGKGRGGGGGGWGHGEGRRARRQDR